MRFKACEEEPTNEEASSSSLSVLRGGLSSSYKLKTLGATLREAWNSIFQRGNAAF